MKTRICQTILRSGLLGMLMLLALAFSALPGAAAPRASAPDFAAIDRYVEQEMVALRLPGLALGIVQGNRIVHLKGFGVADPSGRLVTPQTPFHMASIGKSFTALAIMQLVEAGKVNLDAPVQRYLPFFRVADAQASAQITVRQILNQTSGIPNAANGIAERHTGADALEQGVRALATVELDRPVGASFEYADVNYAILGLIVQVVSGQPYAQYIQQQIFAPLEMQHAYLDPAEDATRGASGYAYWFGFPRPGSLRFVPAIRPAGGDSFIASAEDMGHYLIAQLNGGRYGAQRLLSAAGIATLHQPAVSLGVHPVYGASWYGMGWGQGTLNGVPIVFHSGDISTFHADIMLAPEGRWGVIVLMNGQTTLQTMTGDERIEAIAPGVVGLLHGQQPPAQPVSYGIWLVYAVLLLLVAIQIAGMGRSILLLQRWRVRPVQRPARRRAVLRRIGLPLALNLAWGLAILAGIPALAKVSLQHLSYDLPDVVATLTVSAVVALGWGFLRMALAMIALRKSQALIAAGAHPVTDPS
jgi:CubicO group peptidase (beta-lactamase class C family)